MPPNAMRRKEGAKCTPARKSCLPGPSRSNSRMSEGGVGLAGEGSEPKGVPEEPSRGTINCWRDRPALSALLSSPYCVGRCMQLPGRGWRRLRLHAWTFIGEGIDPSGAPLGLLFTCTPLSRHQADKDFERNLPGSKTDLSRWILSHKSHWTDC
ncbi:unnamed protein product [Ixodes persulcatus]